MHTCTHIQVFRPGLFCFVNMYIVIIKDKLDQRGTSDKIDQRGHLIRQNISKGPPHQKKIVQRGIL